MFLANPEPQPKIISSDAFAGNAYYNAERVLTRIESDFAGTIWVIPEGGQGEFIMDMGLDVLLVGVELVNTVNRDVGRDRAKEHSRCTWHWLTLGPGRRFSVRSWRTHWETHCLSRC